MPTPVAPGIVALEAIWLQEDQFVENTFNYHMPDPRDVAALTVLANRYETWAAAHTGIFHNACQLVKVQARDLSSTSGASIILNIDPPVQGTGGAGALPNNCTFSLKRLTGLRGRKNRGRIYLIGVSDIHLQTGSQQLTAAFAATSVAAYNLLLANMLSDASATEVIYHKSTGTGTNVIGYAYADLFMDSSRRRLPGHNIHH